MERSAAANDRLITAEAIIESTKPRPRGVKIAG